MNMKNSFRQQPSWLLNALALAVFGTACLPVNGDEKLGRLFFTPEQRQRLDRQRQHSGALPATVESTLTINGVVTRKSGKRTVWINGVSRNDNETPDGVVVKTSHDDPAAVTVVPDAAAAAKARVGATVDRQTAEFVDILGSGRLGIHSQATASRSRPP